MIKLRIIGINHHSATQPENGFTENYTKGLSSVRRTLRNERP
jgi:hypothetical protein